MAHAPFVSSRSHDTTATMVLVSGSHMGDPDCPQAVSQRWSCLDLKEFSVGSTAEAKQTRQACNGEVRLSVDARCAAVRPLAVLFKHFHVPMADQG